VNIQNTAPEPEAYFIDPRLPGTTPLTLGALNTPSVTEPTNVTSTIPLYLIPTHTTSLSEQATTAGSQPIQFDSGSSAGDPDIFSDEGSTATGSFADKAAAEQAARTRERDMPTSRSRDR